MKLNYFIKYFFIVLLSISFNVFLKYKFYYFSIKISAELCQKYRQYFCKFLSNYYMEIPFLLLFYGYVLLKSYHVNVLVYEKIINFRKYNVLKHLVSNFII